MNKPRPRRRFGVRSSRRQSSRRGSLYVVVAGVALIISIISVAAMEVTRLELRSTAGQQDQAYARVLAQSSIELAVSQLKADPSWRSSYTHGTEYPYNQTDLGVELAFQVRDATGDGDLADDDTEPVEIWGIGRYGGATHVYSVDYVGDIPAEQQVGPVVVASYQESGTTTGIVEDYAFFGQYFVPNLPIEATTWSLTEVDIFLENHGAPNGSLNVRIFDSIDGKPASAMATVTIPETDLPQDGFEWQTVPFTGASGLIAGAGHCLTLEGTGPGTTAVVPYATAVTQTDSHLLRGGWGGWNTDADQSLLYRIRGYYTTVDGTTGKFAIVPGSWRHTPTP